jgi:hypothetical protein
MCAYYSQTLPTVSIIPDQDWQQEPVRFVMDCHYRLMSTFKAKWMLYNLGFTDGTMQDFYLGWYSDKENTRCLPVGLVIPTFEIGSSRLIKIRVMPAVNEFTSVFRPDMAGIYGNVLGIRGEKKPVVVVTSELDAMLVQQFAGDICCPIALGGCLWPDEVCDKVLMSAPRVIYAIDHDGEFSWWRDRYQKVVKWKFPDFRLVDGFKVGITLRKWVLEGLSF